MVISGSSSIGGALNGPVTKSSSFRSKSPKGDAEPVEAANQQLQRLMLDGEPQPEALEERPETEELVGTAAPSNGVARRRSSK